MDAKDFELIRTAGERTPNVVKGLVKEVLDEKEVTVTDEDAPLNINRLKLKNTLEYFQVPSLNDTTCTVGVKSSFNELANYITQHINYIGELVEDQAEMQEYALV